MSVAKNALHTRGFAAAGISVVCMLAAACLTAGVTCNQVAYASETESQSQAASAQGTQNASYLYAVRDSETNLWGFADAAGTQVIPCQFESLGSLPGQSPSLVTTYSPNNGSKSYFPDFGCAYDLPGGVMNDDPFPAQDPDTEKWGYIDKSGEWVIEPEYEQARMFSDGLGLVYSEDKGAGYVNAQGELVASGYIAATSFSDGVAFVSGKLDDEKNGIKHNNSYAAIDKNGAWALNSAKSSTETDRYCYKQPVFFHDGVGFEGIEDGKAVYVDSKGNEALSASSGHDGVSIAAAEPFYDGYATIRLQGNDMWAEAGYTGMDGTTAYGLIDKTGALVKDPTAKSTQWATLVDLWGGINHVGGGMVAAQDSVSGLWGYLDAKSGEWKIQPLFSEAKPFADGMAYAKDFATGDWGIIDDSGAWTAVPRLDNFNSDDQSLVAAGGLVYGTAEARGGAASVTSEGWMNAQGLWVASWEL